MWWRNKNKESASYHKDVDRRILGHRFYVELNPGNLPLRRKQAFMQQLIYSSWGVNDTDIEAFEDVLTKSIKAEDWLGAATAIGYFREKRKGSSHIKQMLRLASTFIWIDNEPYRRESPQHNKKKMQLCEKSDEVLDFFLRNILIMRGIGITSPEFSNLMDYFLEPKNRRPEEVFYRMMGTGIWDSE